MAIQLTTSRSSLEMPRFRPRQMPSRTTIINTMSKAKSGESFGMGVRIYGTLTSYVRARMWSTTLVIGRLAIFGGLQRIGALPNRPRDAPHLPFNCPGGIDRSEHLRLKGGAIRASRKLLDGTLNQQTFASAPLSGP